MPTTRAKITDGASLSPDRLDTLYALRAAHVHLKDDASPRADRATFDATMRRSTHVCVLTSGRRDVGFVCADLLHIQAPEDAWVLHFHYAFIEPEHRGGRAYIYAFLKDLTLKLAQHPRSALYYYGTAFKPSFVRTRTYCPHLVTPATPARDPRARLLAHLTHTHEGDRWCLERRAVWMPTIPSAGDRQWSRREDREAASIYERLNPSWREG